jgi:signal transduction histidine kinase
MKMPVMAREQEQTSLRSPLVRRGGVLGRLMRVRDSSSPTTVPAYSPPGADPRPAAEALWLEQRPSASEERVLAEIAHELGNFFHKLYYWAEFLQEKRTEHASETTAVQMLTHTVSNLEEFLKGTLEYFRPLKLSPARMLLSDVVAGMVVQLRAQLHGWPVRVTDAGDRERQAVLIDPARLPAVFLAIGRRLTERAPAGSGVHIEVDTRGGEVEAVFRIEGSMGGPAFQSAASCLEWALAERIVALHGGTLEERETGGGPQAVVLSLPLHN